jgi:hypothetical protein
MFNEDNSGFVVFPHPNNQRITGLDVGKTLVYLVAVEPKSVESGLSNVTLSQSGFYSDDVNPRPIMDLSQNIDSLVDSQMEQDEYVGTYFPNPEKSVTRDLVSCICVGWSNLTYSFSKQEKMWNCTFRDLTNEGQRLYYSMKKLHNSKEIRILTFNQI